MLELFDHILVVEDIVEWLNSGWGLRIGKPPREKVIADTLQKEFIDMKKRELIGLGLPASAPVAPLPRKLPSSSVPATSASAPIGQARAKHSSRVFTGVLLSRKKADWVRDGKRGREGKEDNVALPRKKVKVGGMEVQLEDKGEGASGGRRSGA